MTARRLRRHLASERLLLRPLGPSDAEAVYTAVDASRAEVGKWMAWCRPGYSREDSLQYLAMQPAAWERGTEYALGIFETKTGRLLGGTGINCLDLINLRANLGYWVRTDCTGQGIATEAVQLLAPAAMDDLALERIEIVAAVANLPSQRVAENAGATRECVARQRLRTAAGQTDGICFAFIRGDFRLPPVELE